MVECITALLLHQRFARERSERHAVARVVRNASVSRSTIHILVPWGIGEKASLDLADESALSLLEDVRQEVRKLWHPGIEYTFLLADSHADLNRVPRAMSWPYAAQMYDRITTTGSRCLRLSHLWDRSGLSPARVDRTLRRLGQAWWERFPIRGLLKAQASRRSLCGPPELAAMRYALARLLERPFVETAFPDHLMVFYGRREMWPLLPRLPRLLYWSCRKGVSCPPWYMTHSPASSTSLDPALQNASESLA